MVLQQGHYVPAGWPVQPRPIGMQPQPQPQPVPVGGRHDPRFAQDDEEKKRLCARAGGWTEELSIKRALQEAFSSF